MQADILPFYTLAPNSCVCVWCQTFLLEGVNVNYQIKRKDMYNTMHV